MSSLAIFPPIRAPTLYRPRHAGRRLVGFVCKASVQRALADASRSRDLRDGERPRFVHALRLRNRPGRSLRAPATMAPHATDSPFFVRPTIMSRSSSAIGAITRKKNRSIGIVVSIESFRDMKSTPISSNSSVSPIRCLVDLEMRSSLTTTTSPSLRRAESSFSSSGLPLRRTPSRGGCARIRRSRARRPDDRAPAPQSTPAHIRISYRSYPRSKNGRFRECSEVV